MSDDCGLREELSSVERAETPGTPEDQTGCNQLSTEPASSAGSSLSEVDERLDALMSKVQYGEITTAERAELVGLILADEHTGINFPFHVLGIRSIKEIARFIVLRDQVDREMGLTTVYEHLLNDLILGTKYLWEKSVYDEAKLIAYCDDHLGLRSPGGPRDLVRAAGYLRQSSENFSRIRDRLGRDLCRFIRTLQGMRRSQVLLQIRTVQNLNLAEKQINLGGAGTATDDTCSGSKG